MRKFDYSFLSNGLLPARLVNLTASIASLKTMAGIRKKEYTRVFTELELSLIHILRTYWLMGLRFYHKKIKSKLLNLCPMKKL